MNNRDIVFTLKFKNQAAAVMRKFGGQLKTMGVAAEKARKGLKRLGDSFKRLADKASRAGMRMKAAGAQIREAGTQMTFAIGAPLAAAIGFTVKAFAELEQAMAGVQKTVGGPASAIEALKQEFIEMSNTIPTAATELARMGQVAGQLGIGVKDIGNFTRVIAEFVRATDVGAEEASFSLARLANIMQIPTSQTRNLASSMVALGNSFAANEPEIIAMSLRIAKAGTVVGLTAGEVFGFSSALASVGVKAQAGGTAISKAFIGINKAVNAGGKKLTIFADIAGVSVDEFTRLFREDAATAFQLFISGLEATRKAGGDVFKTLEDLGLQNIRTQQALLGLMLANDSLTASLALGNKAFEEGTALEKEFAIFLATTSSQLKILWNRVTNAAAVIGKAFSPTISKVIEKLKDVALKVQEWAEKLKDVDVALIESRLKILGIVIAAGPMLVVLGSLVQLLGFAASGFALLGKSLAKTAVFLATNPFGLLIVAIGLVIAAFVKFRNSLIEIEGTTARVQDYVVVAFQMIWEKIKWVGDNVVQLWQFVANSVAPMFGDPADQMVSDFTTAFNAFKAIGNSIIQLFQLVGLAIATILTVPFTIITNIAKDVVAQLTKAKDAVKAFLSGNRKLAAEILKKPTGPSPFEGLKEQLTGELDAVLKGDPLGDFFAKLGDRAGERYQEHLAKGFSQSEALSNAVKDVAEEIGGDRGPGPDTGRSFAKEFNIGAKTAFDEYIKGARDIAGQTEKAFANAFQGIEDGLMEFLETGKFGFKEFAKSIISDFARIGVKSLMGDVMSLLSGGEKSETGLLSGLGAVFGGGGAAVAAAGTPEGGGEGTAGSLSPDGVAIVGAVTTGTAENAGLFAGLGTSLSGLGTSFMTGLQSLGTTLGGLFSSIGSFFTEGGGSDIIGGVAGALSAFASEGGVSDTLSKKGMVGLGTFQNARKFAQGGVTSGTDRIPALLSPNEAIIPLSRNRAVPIEGNLGGVTNVTINVQANDVESFKQSRSQMLARTGTAIARARRKTQ